MYAVIRAGGQQFKVSPGDIIKLTKSVSHGSNGKVEFGAADVLAISSEPGKIGKPEGDGASVTAEVVDEGRSKKIIVFHYKRKKQYKKLQGHRQAFTALRITEIAYDGQKFSAPALPAKKVKARHADEHAVGEHAVEHKASAGKKAATHKAGGKSKKALSASGAGAKKPAAKKHATTGKGKKPGKK
jgi:large subunit ribosomal protein L21